MSSASAQVGVLVAAVYEALHAHPANAPCIQYADVRAFLAEELQGAYEFLAQPRQAAAWADLPAWNLHEPIRSRPGELEQRRRMFFDQLGFDAAAPLDAIGMDGDERAPQSQLRAQVPVGGAAADCDNAVDGTAHLRHHFGRARLGDPRRIGAPQRAARRRHPRDGHGPGPRSPSTAAAEPAPSTGRIRAPRPAGPSTTTSAAAGRSASSPSIRSPRSRTSKTRTRMRRETQIALALAAAERPPELAGAAALRPPAGDRPRHGGPQQDGRRLLARQRHLRLAVLPAGAVAPHRGTTSSTFAETLVRLQLHHPRPLRAADRAGDAGVHRDRGDAVVRALRDVRRADRTGFRSRIPSVTDQSLRQTLELSRSVKAMQQSAAMLPRCAGLPRRRGGPAAAAGRQLDRELPLQTMLAQIPYENTSGRLRAFQHRRHRPRPRADRLVRRAGDRPARRRRRSTSSARASACTTRAIVAGGKTVAKVELISRQVLKATFPAGLRPRRLPRPADCRDVGGMPPRPPAPGAAHGPRKHERVVFVGAAAEEVPPDCRRRRRTALRARGA